MRATERIVLLENENATLRKNVKDVQRELANANIRIAEVVADNKNKQEALRDVAKILKDGLTRHEKETWSQLEMAKRIRS